jgi:hypothetical protein
MARMVPTDGEPTTKLSLSVPASVRADLLRATAGGNASRYVSQVLAEHFAEKKRREIVAGAALLAEELDDDVPDEVYDRLRETTNAR